MSVYLHVCAHVQYACGCRCSHATACPSEGVSPCLPLSFPAASFSGSSGLTDARVRHLACVRTPGIQIGVLMFTWQPLLPMEPPPPPALVLIFGFNENILSRVAFVKNIIIMLQKKKKKKFVACTRIWKALVGEQDLWSRSESLVVWWAFCTSLQASCVGLSALPLMRVETRSPNSWAAI